MESGGKGGWRVVYKATVGVPGDGLELGVVGLQVVLVFGGRGGGRGGGTIWWWCFGKCA